MTRDKIIKLAHRTCTTHPNSPELPKPFKKQGEQIAGDGDTICFCDLYENSQMIAMYKKGFDEGRATLAPAQAMNQEKPA
jgi:hypothetical protein